jgi:hypothetical protein
MRDLRMQQSWALSLVCDVALRANLDYSWRSALVKNFKGLERCNRLRNGLFTGRDLQYDQDFSNGELQPWMAKNDTAIKNERTPSSEVKFLWQPESYPRTKNSACSSELEFETCFSFVGSFVCLFIGIPSYPSYQPLPQIALYWVEIRD